MNARCLLGCSVAVALAAFGGFQRSHQAAPAPRSPDSPVPGVFEGRTPCGDVALAFTGFPAQNCEKIKWRLILYRDLKSGRPAAYRYDGTRTRREGAWAIVRGTPTDPDAVVYRLKDDTGATSLALLEVGDSLLLLLDRNLEPLVGDASWSYTLNRTDRMPGH